MSIFSFLYHYICVSNHVLSIGEGYGETKCPHRGVGKRSVPIGVRGRLRLHN